MEVVVLALLVFMLISTSSVFDLHVIISVYVIFNILKLIMKIVPNYSTHRWCSMAVAELGFS